MSSTGTADGGSTTLADEDSGLGYFALTSCTNVGLKRTRNEDFVSTARSPSSDCGGILIVADGMGGHANGEKASHDAVGRIQALYLEGKLGSADAIRTAFNDVDNYLHANLDGGGTTLVLAIVADSGMTVANIGDSRAYLLRAHSLRQLTTDDSWVQSQVDSGHITAAQARAHPRRNVLLKALGPGRSEGAAVSTMRFLPGDTVMLCSDGLHGVVSDEQVEQVLNSDKDLSSLCSRLIQLALDGGAPDNVSVAICRLEHPEAGSSRDNPERL